MIGNRCFGGAVGRWAEAIWGNQFSRSGNCASIKWRAVSTHADMLAPAVSAFQLFPSAFCPVRGAFRALRLLEVGANAKLSA